MPATSQRLQAATGRQHEQALARADAAASRVDQAIAGVWRQLMFALRRQPDPWIMRREGQDLTHELLRVVRAQLHVELERQAQQTWQRTTSTLASTLPLAYLHHAALRHPRPLLERAAPDEDDSREQLRHILFPAPTEHQVRRILQTPIAGSTWQQALDHATRLAQPESWSGILAGGLAAGKAPKEIARTLEPAVQNVRTTAMRLARTYGMQVAHAVQRDAHAQLGDLVIGWKVHALHDQHTRPWHATRDGTIYYLHPQLGQKGMRQCPHPPLEAEDPAERPPKTPHTAWNCRCWISPVLRPL